MNFKMFLRVFGIIAIILTVFPFIPVDHWLIRVFDFPHLQLTLLTLLALLTYFLRFDLKNIQDYIFVIVLFGCFLFQSIKIYPYTAFAPYEVQNASKNSLKSFSVYTANVLQTNDNFKGLLEDTKKQDADILLFTETDRKWVNELTKILDKSYPYKIEVPKDNTYGMLFFSKFELYDNKIKYLIEDTIPSIHTKIILPFQDTIQLFAIHPAPPMPQHNPSSVDRDAEMMKITKLTRYSPFPVIVLGDFNDVAWSETTELFQKISGLLDLRKGRGFYSTFNAKNWLMRWPLDHIFTSPEFRVKQVYLGEKFGSDHFPFFTELSFEPQLAGEQRLKPPTKDEIDTAFDQIEKEKEED
ncbi:endonuclease/exonuclease/phosphatase family protein [Arenibacter sp. BSSL-BM3]|uniref:Endonuclease/exonuclease/phosphatase family protein n=1 Tax=Arenibacter arenosicollis TaxID=2762274 RepID=A0ABR7QRJ4_9FLAO|nr:endonuclease/exonuclease/phosphatase family protein [Arenibacter arenosicollis]MBC8769778.1 endonuclease/exonuclease/phosphatase family protein [Arenibacter arenosicollis]